MWSTPSDRARAAEEDTLARVSRVYPARLIDDHRLHVFESCGVWEVWLNTEASDFDGLCIGTGRTRDAAVRQAVCTMEACAAALQEPRSEWEPSDA